MTPEQRCEFHIAQQLMDKDDTLGLTAAIKAAGVVRNLLITASLDAYELGKTQRHRDERYSLLDKERPEDLKSWMYKRGLKNK